MKDVLLLFLFPMLLSSCGGSGSKSQQTDACLLDGCQDQDSGWRLDYYQPNETLDWDAWHLDMDASEGPCRGFGCPCNFNEDCDSGWCVLVDAASGERLCTITCLDWCPDGWGCKNVGLIGSDPLFLCMPAIDPLCHLPCLKDADCGVGNLCVKMESSQFCLRQCAVDEDCPEDYACQEVSNLDGSVIANQCFPVSGHCLCSPDVDYMSDVDHCGSCENKCSFAHGIAMCLNGSCRLIGCEEGYFNLNQQDADGCEYACTFQSTEDDPDPQYIDANCDGIDGVISNGVFVDAATGDDDNVLGDMAHPFKTISAAIAFAAQQSPKKQVYVSKGQYREQVRLIDGVSLYGGYDAANGWKRDIEKNRTMIIWDGQEPLAVRTVIAENIISKTVFDGFYVKTSSAFQPSGSSYGVYVYHASNGLVISNNQIEAGNGADGKSGLYGLNGLNGNDGAIGSPSFEYDGCAICFCEILPFDQTMKPGAGGTSPCGNRGGMGGKGGKHEQGGFPGESAPNGGGQGGLGAPGATMNGLPGQNGADGKDGAHGKGGKAAGTLSPAGLWMPGNGEDGQDGEHGKGGGGGGGGGGDSGCFLGICCESAGGAGGGGGGGGCGGGKGTGGSGGGSSFGVFIVEASPVLTGNVIISQSGGNGGNGGEGGQGGDGGRGGEGGGKAESDNAGRGGSGGNGGKGGRGGGGGGGAGGSTFPVYIVGASSNPLCSNNEYMINGFPGAGGYGGAGAINKGENGQSGTVYGATLGCPAK